MRGVQGQTYQLVVGRFSHCGRRKNRKLRVGGYAEPWSVGRHGWAVLIRRELIQGTGSLEALGSDPLSLRGRSWSLRTAEKLRAGVLRRERARERDDARAVRLIASEEVLCGGGRGGTLALTTDLLLLHHYGRPLPFLLDPSSTPPLNLLSISFFQWRLCLLVCFFSFVGSASSFSRLFFLGSVSSRLWLVAEAACGFGLLCNWSGCFGGSTASSSRRADGRTDGRKRKQ